MFGHRWSLSDVSRLSPIKDQLPDHVTYDHIKLSIAILKRRHGIPGSNFGATTVIGSRKPATSSSASSATDCRKPATSASTSSMTNTPVANQSVTDKLQRFQRSVTYDASGDKTVVDDSPADVTSAQGTKRRALPSSFSLKRQKTSDKLKKNSLFKRWRCWEKLWAQQLLEHKCTHAFISLLHLFVR